MGRVGGRFTRRRPLGRGGSGVVFEAVDEETGALVALKALHTPSADDVARLKEEFRALAGVYHPNLVDLYELVATGDECVLAMELVEGTTFLDWVRPGVRVDRDAETEAGPVSDAGDDAPSLREDGSEPGAEPTGDTTLKDPIVRRDSGATAARPIRGAMDETRLRRALAELVDGLGALHAAGKVHRDLKPGNVLVTHEGRVKLLDFGLTIRRGDKGIGIEGTPTYMAPEQIEGGAATPATDAYALGVMLFQALTGAPPFRDRMGALLDKLSEAAPSVHSVAKDAPADLAALCDRLLARAPKDRPTGAEIAEIVGGSPRLHPSSGASSAGRVAPQGDLVGRAAEADRLLDAVNQARRNAEARLVFVTGPSGVGKSALVEEVCRRVELGQAGSVESGVVLRGRCSEREVVPYPGVDGIVDALRMTLAQHRFDAVRDTSGAARRELGQLFPIVEDRVAGPRPTDAVEARRAASAGLHALLARIAREVPLVLVLDDVQWLTEDACAILAVALRCGDLPVAVLATLRETNATERAGLAPSTLARMLGLHADTLALGRLDPDASAAIVRRVAGADAPSAAVDAIVREAGGHPLLLDMLARSFVGPSGARDVSPTERAQVDGVREGDRALVDRPLANADPRLRRVLEHVAIAGEGITLECLAEVVGVPLATIVGLASELQRLRLVRASGIGRRSAVSVAHDRIRAAALSMLDRGRIAAMHGAIGEVAERLEPERVEVLVHHFEAAGDRERVGSYARAAGEAAARVLAFDRAARWYALALERGKTDATVDPERAELRAARAESLALAGHALEAGREFERAAEEKSGDAVLLQRATDQHLRGGAVERGVELLGRILRPWGIHVPRSPRGALVALLLRRAELWLRGFGFRPTPEADARAADLARVDALTSAAAGLALVDNILGSYFQTTSLLLALRAGEPGRVLRAFAIEASYSSSVGPKGARRTAKLLARTRDVAATIDTAEARAWSRAAVAFAASLETNWTVALDACRDGQRIFVTEVPGSYWEVSTLRLFESFALYYLGRFAELRRLVDERHADAITRGDVHAQVTQSTSTPGVSLVAADEAELELARADRAMSIWTRAGFHVEHWWRAYAVGAALLYLGRIDDARAHYDEMWPGLERSLLLMVHLTRAEAWFMRGSIAVAACARAPDAAQARIARRAVRLLLGEASAFARGLGASLAAAKDRLAGQSGRALDQLGRAEAAFVDAAMPAHVAAVRWSVARMSGDDAAAAIEEARLVARGIIRPRRFVAVLIGAHDLADPGAH